MSAEDSYIDEFKEERKKLKTLSFGAKIVYIWDYYKIPIILLCLFIALIIFFIRSYIDGSKEDVLYAISINNDVSDDGTEILTDDFLTSQGMSLKDYAFNNDFALYMYECADDYDENSSIGGELDYTTEMKILTLIAAQDLDIIFSNEGGVNYFMRSAALADLSTFLPEDLWEELEPYTLTVAATLESADRSDPYPCAINLSAITDLPETCGMSAEPVYISFVANTQKQDMVITYLRYLLDDAGKESAE